MFNKNSRYYALETITAKDRQGRKVEAVKLRRLPETDGIESVVTAESQLDVMCERHFKDPTKFWHIGDANSDLKADELVETVGRVINIPKR